MKIVSVAAANIFISGGDETNRQRNTALATFRTVEQMYGRLGTPLAIKNWDFRIEPGETIPAGTFSRRSIQEARNAYAVIGIFGGSVPLPPVTKLELEDFYKRHAEGEDVDIAVFMKRPVSRAHHAWRKKVERQHNIEIVYDDYADNIEFQRRLFSRLMIMLLPTLPPAAILATGRTL